MNETAHTGRVRFVPVDQLAFAIPEVDLADEAHVAITRAARRRLGLPEYHLVPPPVTMFSADEVRSAIESSELPIASRSSASPSTSCLVVTTSCWNCTSRSLMVSRTRVRLSMTSPIT